MRGKIKKKPKNKHLSYSGSFGIQCLLPSQRDVLMFKTEVAGILSGEIFERGKGTRLHRMHHWYLHMLMWL